MIEQLRTTIFSDKRYLRVVVLAIFASIIAGISPLAMLLIAAIVIVVLLTTRLDWATPVFIVASILGTILPPFQLHLLFFGVAITWVRVIGPIAILATVFYLTKNKIDFRWNVSLTFMTLFVLWTFVSLLWADDLRDAVVRAVAWSYLLAFYVLFTQLLADLELREIALKALILGGVILIILGIVSMPGSTQRLDVFGLNPNSISAKLLMTLLGVYWLYKIKPIFKDSFVNSAFKLVYLILAAALVISAGSRGEAIALILLVVLLMIRRETWRFAFWFIPLLLVVGLVIMSQSLSILERFSDISDLGGRTGLYGASWRLFLETPWLGLGVGNVQRVLGASMGLDRGLSPHNPLLVVLLDTGIIGFVFYFLMIAAPVFQFFRRIIREQRAGVNIPYNVWFTAAMFVVYMISWNKSGGAQHDVFIYFFLALMAMIVAAPDLLFEEL